jgi:hypothetical protein
MDSTMIVEQTKLGTFRLSRITLEVPIQLGDQPRPANKVWTRAEWITLCTHLHNMNDETRFVMGFRNNGAKEYVKSKKKVVSEVIPWSWDSIRGHAKSKVAFVPYSQNADRKSRWGAIDFDAHDGNGVRAKRFAFESFRLLLNVESLFIILEPTGSGGWHLWAVAKDFHPVNDWVRLLKWVADTIGAPIESGICEIFPPDGADVEFGKGLRAPGCWNPGTDTLSEILWHNTTALLEELMKESHLRESHFPEKKKEVSFSVFSSEQEELYRLWYSDWRHTFRIDRPSTRNDRLTHLVGTMFHQVGFAMAKRIVEAHYFEKQVATEASLERHTKDFLTAWSGMKQEWIATLLEREREALQSLSTEIERDAFRIIRSFERQASIDQSEDFPIVRDNLGDRLGISGPGAAGVRDKLKKLGIIQRTQAYKANQAAARYRWLLNTAEQAAGQPF